MNFNEDLKIEGFITITHTDKDGNLKGKRETKNLITSAGKAQIALLAGDASAVPFTYLALGTGSTAADVANTTLEAETVVSGLARAAATVARVTTTVTNDTLQLTKAFTSAGAETLITECGILNAASTGTLLGRQVFTALDMVTGDICTIVYKIKFA